MVMKRREIKNREDLSLEKMDRGKGVGTRAWMRVLPWSNASFHVKPSAYAKDIEGR
jgi:hypothetical protein